jgi:hypothetical protein
MVIVPVTGSWAPCHCMQVNQLELWIESVDISDCLLLLILPMLLEGTTLSEYGGGRVPGLTQRVNPTSLLRLLGCSLMSLLYFTV